MILCRKNIKASCWGLGNSLDFYSVYFRPFFSVLGESRFQIFAYLHSLGIVNASAINRALFVTINAVEIFVEKHYMEQIEPLRAGNKFPELTR